MKSRIFFAFTITMFAMPDNCRKYKGNGKKPMIGGMMFVTFSTGEKRLFDTTKLKGSAFQPLSDERIFNNPTLFHGVITWNNGEIDTAPETVYKESYVYDE